MIPFRERRKFVRAARSEMGRCSTEIEFVMGLGRKGNATLLSGMPRLRNFLT